MLCDSGNCFPNSCKSSGLIQVSQIKAGDESGRVGIIVLIEQENFTMLAANRETPRN